MQAVGLQAALDRVHVLVVQHPRERRLVGELGLAREEHDFRKIRRRLAAQLDELVQPSARIASSGP